LDGEECAELAEEAGAVFGVHGDDLNADAAILLNVTDDASAANFARGSIEKDLNQAAERHGQFGAHEKTAKAEAVHVGDVVEDAGLPGDDHTFRGLYAGVLPLFRSAHDRCSRMGILAGRGVLVQKTIG